MQHYDIWSADLKSPSTEQHLEMDIDLIERVEEELPAHEQLLLQDYNDNDYSYQLSNFSSVRTRQPKVIHLFPVPVDGECLSDDGRRLGNCFNAYECRQKGGQARGECAMGFGVCCVFLADCNGTIANNLTYIVSPGFPSFMPSNFTECKIKVKIMGDEVSQLRLDFHHFSLGQPNRRTGACDGDVFNITGGPRGSFLLCGQNSGQHLYYDVGTRSLPRQSTLYGSLRPALPANATASNQRQDQLIEISLNVSKRFLPMRLWEIRVLQIPFSQRAPAGCLQYHTGVEGVIQTFNFAENGRHLANQHYRICVRQELERCSISYQPCDEQSFRIGGGLSNMNGGSSSTATAATPIATSTTGSATTATTTTSNLFQMLSNWINNTTTTSTTATTTTATTNASTTATVAATTESSSSSSSTSAMPTTAMTTTATPVRSSTTAAQDDYPEYNEPEADDEYEETPSSSPANDDVEGSGGNEDYDSGSIFDFFGGGNRATTAQPGVSRRPRPVGGASSSSTSSSSSGFDLFGFLRSAFDLRLRHRRRRREARQFFSTCSDRITMPCIIEDFIGTGLGPLPGCEPVHCGSQFCSSGVWPCRIESTVTPFYIGVHFGDGRAPGKANAEENIGACLRYSQVQCI